MDIVVFIVRIALLNIFFGFMTLFKVGFLHSFYMELIRTNNLYHHALKCNEIVKKRVKIIRYMFTTRIHYLQILQLQSFPLQLYILFLKEQTEVLLLMSF